MITPPRTPRTSHRNNFFTAKLVDSRAQLMCMSHNHNTRKQVAKPRAF